MHIQEVLQRLKNVKGTGRQYTARCPCHEDEANSLSVSEGEKKVVVECHAGCDYENIIRALGMDKKDLYFEPLKPAHDFPQKTSPAYREHVYRNCKGESVAVKCIDKLAKCKAVWYLISNGVRANKTGLDGLKIPCYNADKVYRCTEKIYICEGEKDADTVCRMGLCGTSLPNGAGSKYYSELHDPFFKGKPVVIIGDNDTAGETYAATLKKALPQAEIVDLKDCLPDLGKSGDITDVAEKLGLEKTKELLINYVAKPMPVQEAGKTYDLADFQTEQPYEEIYSITDFFKRQMRTNEIELQAKLLGYKDFKKMQSAYMKSKKGNRTDTGNVTDFMGQKLQLDCGEWTANDSGITRGAGDKTEQTLTHVLLPTEHLRNLDTGNVKIKIEFSRELGKWEEIIVDIETVSSERKILSLARYDIAVTSGNAKNLVQYLHDLMSLNYDTIPKKKSVSHLGYVEKQGFVPYIDGVQFDGMENLKHIFESVASKGSADEWLKKVSELRKYSKELNIGIVSSFMSVMLKHLNILPFFVHYWGGESGTGKTLAVRIAASVWGNPTEGNYTQTFNSTKVLQEVVTGFLHQLPLCIDELQMDDKTFNVYFLSEGVGKGRSNVKLGFDKPLMWKNVIITSGESPLTNQSDGAGALNRTIELEITKKTLFEDINRDGTHIASFIEKNYGHAGRIFVEKFYGDLEENLTQAENLMNSFKDVLLERGISGKQAIAGALILTASYFADIFVFNDRAVLDVEDIINHLKTEKSVSVGERGYEDFCDWVNRHAAKFSIYSPDCYGVLEADYAYINPNVFRNACKEMGYNSLALLSQLKSKNYIKSNGKRYDFRKRYLVGEGNETNGAFIALKRNND